MQNRLAFFSKEGHRHCLTLGTEKPLKPFPGLNFAILCLQRCEYKCNFQHLCALMFHFVNYITVSRNNLARTLIKSTSCWRHTALHWAVPLSCLQPRAAQHLRVMPENGSWAGGTTCKFITFWGVWSNSGATKNQYEFYLRLKWKQDPGHSKQL